MAQLEFDENVVAQLEEIYRSRDVLRRRLLVREALAPAPGERVLDVGCGPGYYAAEIREAIGPEGSVVGVDSSAGMLAVATHRCREHGGVEFREGDATELPVEDASFDAALSVQVLEYVEDVAAALAEIRRALRPGGRVVLWDVDWTTLSLHSVDSDRSNRVLRVWDEHLADPALPRTLTARMRAAGFEDVRAEGHSFTTTALDPETYGGALVPFIRRFAVDRGFPEDEADAWEAELRELDERGEFYLAVVQVCFAAVKPA
ncbi:MAG TPA: methyltransferase domain-containing protein [Thermoleophilaceae bacterium]|jgi:SAM-dependent methyltransferase